MVLLSLKSPYHLDKNNVSVEQTLVGTEIDVSQIVLLSLILMEKRPQIMWGVMNFFVSATAHTHGMDLPA
jgi:hypothetical protein